MYQLVELANDWQSISVAGVAITVVQGVAEFQGLSAGRSLSFLSTECSS